MNAERRRLREEQQRQRPWKKWGPYLADRQWGTVREDYSPRGNAWEYLSHDAARSRTYRWGEDGIAGLADDQQLLCFAVALWNGQDPILKERLFGLTGNEGNHGEDVKELYYYLDATPTHSYCKALYKYPQRDFPYARLVEENRRRPKSEPEFDLLDTGIFDDGRYFDVVIEYAKASPEDVLIRLTVHNRGPEEAPLDLVPQLWFRNTWGFGQEFWGGRRDRPRLELDEEGRIAVTHPALGGGWRSLSDHHYGRMWLHASNSIVEPEFLFCANETNTRRLYGLELEGYAKDGIHDFVVGGRSAAVNPLQIGTKAGILYRLEVPAGGRVAIEMRLTDDEKARPWSDFNSVLERRRREANLFYADLQEGIEDEDARRVGRQALAGLLWSKQFYYYDVERWLDGDPGHPPPPRERSSGRNRHWRHLKNADVISMPDKWEYPWYAAWDLAFHCLPLALVDADFAKQQLLLMLSEEYLHPNGQLPAYEWAFGDVNPPVHAWAVWRVFQIDRKASGEGDIDFLERAFHKLLLNFTWWVNRKDPEGNNVFEGGFLGLDNIGVFDRSAPLPTGGHIHQSDGTSWMAMYCLNLMRIALELGRRRPVYEDMAIKFFEHFLAIAHSMANMGGEGSAGRGLWDEQDEFYYDVLHLPDHQHIFLRVRSMVGLIPLFAVETLEPELEQCLPKFYARLEWVLENRPELAALVSHWEVPGRGMRRLLSLLRGHRMKCLLRRMLDESEFLSEYGVRALSRHHLENPYEFHVDGETHRVRYQPAESDTELFGGNSNWRGPIWFPVNYLIIESLQKFHHYYGDDFKIECPAGSGRHLTILEMAEELGRRLARLFLRDENGWRPVFGNRELLQEDPHFRDHLLFYEYFHGDNGRGVGASHQTGWTALVAKLLQPRRSPS